MAFDNLEAAAQARTPREDLAQLRGTVGGLCLAYKLMSAKLHMTARVMLVATKACWTSYSREVEQVKSAREGSSRTLAASQGKWAKDWHLGLGIRQTMYDFTNLAFMGCDGGGENAKLQAERACFSSLHLLGQRAWPMAVRHNGPPMIYAPMLIQSDETEAVAASMRRRWVWSSGGMGVRS